MNHCRGCGAAIPPRLAWPRHCGPECVERAVERAIKRAMASPARNQRDHEDKKPKEPRKPLYCEWCQVLLPSDRTRWCSHDHRRAALAKKKEEAAARVLQRTPLPEPLWLRLRALASLPRVPRGTLDQLENQFARPPGTLKVYLWNLRTGQVPDYQQETST